MKDSYVFDSEELFKDNLVQAVEHCMPDMFEEIYNDCINREDKELNNKHIFDKDIKNCNDKKYNKDKESLKSLYRGISAVAAIFAIIISICFYNDISRQKEIKSVVMLDVNPSISLCVNKYDKVIKAKGINKDGTDVIKDVNLNKVDIEIALDRIIGAMINKGFIAVDNGTMLITIDNKDVKDGKRLENKTKKNVNKILKASHIKINVLSQIYSASNDVKDMAQSYKISEGKAKIIKSLTNKKIIDNEGNVISEKELAKCNINEIKTLLNNNDISIEELLLVDSVNEGTYVENSQINSNKEMINKDINESKKEDILVNTSEDKYELEDKENDTKYENSKSDYTNESKKENILGINKITNIKVNVKKEENIVASGKVSLTNNNENEAKEQEDITDNKNNNIPEYDTNNKEIEESLESINKSESIVGNIHIKNEDINNHKIDHKNENINVENSNNKNQYINGSIQINKQEILKKITENNIKLNVKK